MHSALSRFQALYPRFLIVVLLTAVFPHAAFAKIKGVVQEACDLSEEELKAKMVDDVMSAHTLCGEGVTPEHTGGYTCTKVALKECKKTRLRCVTQFICPAAEQKTEVNFLSTPKPVESKPEQPLQKAAATETQPPKLNDSKRTHPVVVPPAGQSMNEALKSTPVAVSSPQTQTQTQIQIPPTPVAKQIAPPPAASVVKAVEPPPAFKPIGTAAALATPTAATNPIGSSPQSTSKPVGAVPASPNGTVVGKPQADPKLDVKTEPKTAVQVEKLSKPVDVQQINLDSFTGQPSTADMIEKIMSTLGSGVLIFILAVSLFFIAAMWRVFEKAGHSGLGAIIPIYNLYKLHRIAGQPGWWLILDLIPLVGMISQVLMNKKIAEKFKASQGVMILTILLPPIGYAVVGFSPKYQYDAASGMPLPESAQA